MVVAEWIFTFFESRGWQFMGYHSTEYGYSVFFLSPKGRLSQKVVRGRYARSRRNQWFPDPLWSSCSTRNWEVWTEELGGKELLEMMVDGTTAFIKAHC